MSRPRAEHGYRMRARFHVRDGRPGFYREGTRELCDPRQTAQLLDASIDAVEAAVAALQAQGIVTMSVELSENMAADQRALHLDLRDAKPSADALDRAVAAAGLDRPDGSHHRERVLFGGRSYRQRSARRA